MHKVSPFETIKRLIMILKKWLDDELKTGKYKACYYKFHILWSTYIKLLIIEENKISHFKKWDPKIMISWIHEISHSVFN